MWHAGTLDPLATWCLLVATWNSTKLIHLLDAAKKEYIFTVWIDGISESLDEWTEVTKLSTSGYVQKSSEELANFLLQQIKQIPPKYSALHIWWERAYSLVRNGIDFTISEREIIVHEVEILSIKNFDISIRMILSSGWYIRSFAPVIGKFFWVEWGYIKKLRRTKIFSHYWTLSEKECSWIDNPLEISYSNIFHTIPTYNIWKDIYSELLLWRSIPVSSFWFSIQVWPIFLLHVDTQFLSYWEVNNWVYTILRNNLL